MFGRRTACFRFSPRCWKAQGKTGGAAALFAEVLDASYGFRNEGWLRSRESALAKAGTILFFLLLKYGIGASVYYSDEVVPDR